MLFKRIKCLLLFSSLILISSCNYFVEKESVPIHDSLKITSKVLNETRIINIWKPKEYQDSKQSYPVLYMLDGGVKEDFPHIATTISILVEQGAIAPLVLVGIENTQRRRDLTGPSAIQADAKIAPVSDGSSEFRKFINAELFPQIETTYRVTNQRAIVGESVAGLFIVETLFKEPTMFDIYLAMDPSLWWNDHWLVEKSEKLIHDLPNKKLKFWFAGSDALDIYQYTEKLSNVLETNPKKSLNWIYSPQPKEHHNTIFRATKVAAFKWGLWH